MMRDIEMQGETKSGDAARAAGVMTPTPGRKHHVLEFSDISFAVNVTKMDSMLKGGAVGEKQILHGISGKVESKQTCAIMGPSGAGKTTLLEALARQPNVVNNKNITLGGSVAIDGVPLTRSFFSKHCSYVPQYDALWSAMTTFENLAYSSHLYGGIPQAERTAKLDRVIEELGLTSCRDVKVGSVFIKGLSGGQKRRLSLGCELVAGTKEIFFLDEPTSGLDAAAASEIMKLISLMSVNFNLIVVCSIHQPSSHVFYAFDRLLLLSTGRTAYFGKATESLEYFERIGFKMQRSMNPADFLLETVNADFMDKATVDKVLSEWEKEEDLLCKNGPIVHVKAIGSDTNPTPDSSSSMPGAVPTSTATQRMRLLMFRAFTCYSRDPAMYLLRFAMYGFMSIFLGATYHDVTLDNRDVQDRLFCILWMVAFFSYMGMVALPAFALEKAIVVKEITNGMYSLAEYVVAIALIQIPIIIVCATIASIGPYWFPILNPSFTRYLFYVLVFSAHLYVIESLAILVAGLVPNFVLGLIVFCSMLSQMFVFNGFFISVGNMPDFLVWIYYTSPFAYTGQALFKIVFSGLDMYGFNECIRRAEYPCYGETGNQVLDAISDSDLDYRDVKPWAWFGVLVAFAVAFRVQFYVFVRKSVY